MIHESDPAVDFLVATLRKGNNIVDRKVARWLLDWAASYSERGEKIPKLPIAAITVGGRTYQYAEWLAMNRASPPPS